MGEALGGDFGTLGGFGENESALKDGLREHRETLRRGEGVRRVKPLCFCDVLGDLGGVLDHVLFAGGTECRVSLIGFLHHGSEQAGEFGKVAFEDGRAEVEIAEDAIQGVVGGVIWGGLEETLGHFGEVVGRSEGEFVFGLEVVKKAALGEFGGGTDVVNRGCRVALGSNHVKCGVEQLGLGFVMWSGGDHRIPIGWYEYTNYLVCVKTEWEGRRED